MVKAAISGWRRILPLLLTVIRAAAVEGLDVVAPVLLTVWVAATLTILAPDDVRVEPFEPEVFDVRTASRR